jgi:hypothetical protein
MRDSDREHIETYRQKQQTVIDRVRGIINRRHNGLYVWGETGVGKTWNIEETLRSAQESGLRQFKKLAGKCSPIGLFELARDFPDAILFIDDDPTLVQDRLSQQMLLHLSDDGRINPENGRNERMITNIKSKNRETCVFTGNVIISNNVRLANMPVLRALQGRIRTYHFRPTTSELTAMLRLLAETIEYADVDIEERREICEFISRESENSQQQIDLRLLKHAISDYLQWKRGEVEVHWKELVVSSMQDYFAPLQALGREERKIQEQDLIVELIEKQSETGGSKEKVIEEWMKYNEKRKTAFYDRLRELPEEWQRQFRALPDKRSSGEAEDALTEETDKPRPTPHKTKETDARRLVSPEEDIEFLRAMIRDVESGDSGLPDRRKSSLLKLWLEATEQPIETFPLLLCQCGEDWVARFKSLPE